MNNRKSKFNPSIQTTDISVGDWGNMRFILKTSYWTLSQKAFGQGEVSLGGGVMGLAVTQNFPHLLQHDASQNRQNFQKGRPGPEALSKVGESSKRKSQFGRNSISLSLLIIINEEANYVLKRMKANSFYQEQRKKHYLCGLR